MRVPRSISGFQGTKIVIFQKSSFSEEKLGFSSKIAHDQSAPAEGRGNSFRPEVGHISAGPESGVFLKFLEEIRGSEGPISYSDDFLLDAGTVTPALVLY